MARRLRVRTRAAGRGSDLFCGGMGPPVDAQFLGGRGRDVLDGARRHGSRGPEDVALARSVDPVLCNRLLLLLQRVSLARCPVAHSQPDRNCRGGVFPVPDRRAENRTQRRHCGSDSVCVPSGRNRNRPAGPAVFACHWSRRRILLGAARVGGKPQQGPPSAVHVGSDSGHLSSLFLCGHSRHTRPLSVVRFPGGGAPRTMGRNGYGGSRHPTVSRASDSAFEAVVGSGAHPALRTTAGARRSGRHSRALPADRRTAGRGLSAFHGLAGYTWRQDAAGSGVPVS